MVLIPVNTLEWKPPTPSHAQLTNLPQLKQDITGTNRQHWKEKG